MVGIVVVSHSGPLAEGVVTLAREMAPPELALAAAGGIGEPDLLGTSADVIRAAIERVMSPDGVLVLMDLGSALMSAELAVELLEGAAGPVRLSDAPLVEGAVAAVVAAGGGASLDEVAAEARSALAMKQARLDLEPQPEEAPLPSAAAACGRDADPIRIELPVQNEIGLHARPAARLVQTVTPFDADVRVSKAGSTATPVSARSLTNIVALGIRRGDTLVLTASGPQSQQAMAALRQLAAIGFGDGLPGPSPPRITVAAGMVINGIGASPGTAIGTAQVLANSGLAPPSRDAGAPDAELASLNRALAAARKAITGDRVQLSRRGNPGEAEIFDAHLALLDDDAILSPARSAIAAGATAEQAYFDAVRRTAAVYRGLADPLLAERSTDVVDVGRRVVNALTGADSEPQPLTGIIIADELTPADATALEPGQVVGIVTARGSTTAHAAIIARALGLPAVVGAGPAVLRIEPGTTVLVDGDAGSVQVDPPQAELAAASERAERRRAQAAAALAHAHEPAALASGERIEVAANIGGVDDARRAVELGAEGVGLLRTEFLFLGRAELPDETEQAETLRGIAAALEGRPLIVRTLDAGADKPLPGLPMPPEANPFLGVRGIRVALAHPDVLSTQLRAILRVAAEHPLKLMLPMVSTLGEIEAARALLTEARAATGITAPLEFGIMVEVPAAALNAGLLARHVDFFSIGTNDLTQYTMAAERGDARLVALLATPQPAVLRLIQATVAAASEHGRWVGVCGEMAGDPASAVLLAGLGVAELSMSAVLIPEVKEALRGVELERARAAADAALHVDSAEAARALGRRLLL